MPRPAQPHSPPTRQASGHHNATPPGRHVRSRRKAAGVRWTAVAQLLLRCGGLVPAPAGTNPQERRRRWAPSAVAGARWRGEDACAGTSPAEAHHAHSGAERQLVHLPAPPPISERERRDAADARPRLASAHVLQGAGGQPRRDRGARVPGGLRGRGVDRRGVPLGGPLVRAPDEGRRGLRDRRARPPGAGLPRPRRHRRHRGPGRGRRGLPGLRLPVGEPRSRRGLRRGGDHLRRSTRRGVDADRKQGAGDRGGRGGRDPHAAERAAVDRRRRAHRGSRGDPVPAVRQGGGRRRRARHAPRRRAGPSPRGRRGVHARGRGGLRRPDRLHRAGRRRAATHRGADPRRRRGQRDPPLRARLLAAATPPEGHRDRPGPPSRPRPPRPDLRRRGALRRGDRLRQRRHRGVPARPERHLRLHRDEPPHPGRAHGHRGGHRRRPGAVAAADRRRRDAGRPGSVAGLRHPPRGGDAVPDHHRGPRQRVPARHGQDHDVPIARRSRRPSRRRHDVHRGRGVGSLRLDAGQADLPRAQLRHGRREGQAGARRVPDPGRLHQHPVPPGGARRPRLRGRRRHHVVHRHPPSPAHRAGAARPGGTADPVPRRRDRQPAARHRPGQRRRAHQAARGRPGHGRARRQPAAAAPARPGGLLPSAARADPGGGHRHDLPRRPPEPAGDAGPHPRPAAGRGPRRPHHAAAVVAGVLGRGDVRRRAALPARGSVGAVGLAARDGAQHLPADAAAWPQHGRLHAVPHGGDRRVRRGGGSHRHRRLPHLRRAQRRRADATGDRGGARHRHRRGRGGAVLHQRPLRPCRAALHPRLLPAPGRSDRRGRRPRHRDQGHGRAAPRAGRRTAW